MQGTNKDDQGAASDRRLKEEIDHLLATARDLHQRGNVRQAATLYGTILSVDANHTDALHLLGVLAHASGDYAAACDLIGRAAVTNPQIPQYHFNHGVSLQAMRRHAEAAAEYRAALAIAPTNRQALENLGVALQDLGDSNAAADAYREALLLDPGSAIANQNLGTLLGNLGDTDAARAHFARALARHPAYGDAHTKNAWMLLLEGNFEDGWKEYEWRVHAETFTANNPIRVVPYPRWDGSPLDGKTILINPEQGIGDEIMFASCYSEVIAAAEHVVIECDPRLAELLARSFPEATVLAAERSSDFRWSAALPAIDWRIPAGSLPRFYRSTLESFGAGSPYLRPDPALQAAWRERVATLAGPLTVGLSWRGGRDPRSGAARSVALQEWLPILRSTGATFVNVQYGDHAAEIESVEREHRVRLHTLEGIDALRNVDEFVALLSVLDLVISIDNSTVFMAAAVGTRVWALLPSSGEWRWLKERSTSPWYGAATLFRQRGRGLPAWRDLLAEVGRRLQQVRQCPPLTNDLVAVPTAPRPSRRAAARGGSAVFLNDSSHWYHYGCSCTSLAIHAELRSRWGAVRSVPIQRLTRLKHLPTTVAAFDDDETFSAFSVEYGDVLATLASGDAVYVNGEGALHGLGPQALGLLYLMYAASTRLGKPVHLINHSCFPDDTAEPSNSSAFALYKKVYEALAFVAVREGISARLVDQMGVRATASFDCLPLFVERHFHRRGPSQARQVLIAGSVSWGGSDVVPELARYIERIRSAGYAVKVLIGANAYLAADDFLFVDALHSECGQSIELLNATSELEWLATIAESSLLVCGRFHHTIAAAFLDTPCIVMESNTPKIDGMLRMLGLNTFLSVRQPSLSDALYTRSLEYLANPGDVAVSHATKAQILDLGRTNFSGPLRA